MSSVSSSTDPGSPCPIRSSTNRSSSSHSWCSRTATTSCRASCSDPSNGSAARRRSCGALGVARKNKDAATTLRLMTSELSRRAAISFPDEDVVVAARVHRPSAYTLLQTLRERRAAAGLHAERRGPGVGPAAREALRRRRPLRRQRRSASRSRVASRRACRCSTPSADQGDRRGEDRLARRRARRPQGSGAHRVRLGRRRRSRVRHLRRRPDRPPTS